MLMLWDERSGLNFGVPHVRRNRWVEQPVRVVLRLGTEEQIGDLSSSNVGGINLGKTRPIRV